MLKTVLTTTERNGFDSSISKEQEQIANAVAAVRETWASIPIERKTAVYVAEDKELEYDE